MTPHVKEKGFQNAQLTKKTVSETHSLKAWHLIGDEEPRIPEVKGSTGR
jgi:hypothetical protein